MWLPAIQELRDDIRKDLYADGYEIACELIYEKGLKCAYHYFRPFLKDWKQDIITLYDKYTLDGISSALYDNRGTLNDDLKKKISV